jgi:hypothetical protein
MSENFKEKEPAGSKLYATSCLAILDRREGTKTRRLKYFHLCRSIRITFKQAFHFVFKSFGVIMTAKHIVI